MAGSAPPLTNCQNNCTADPRPADGRDTASTSCRKEVSAEDIQHAFMSALAISYDSRA